MSWPSEFQWVHKWVDQRLDRLGAIMGRDTSRAAMTKQVDGHRKGSLMQGSIVADHQFEAQLVATVFRKRNADQSATMFAHKVHNLRRNSCRRGDEISFVLTVLVVHNDHDLTVFDILDRIINRIEHISAFL